MTHILLLETDPKNAHLVEQNFRKSKYQISRIAFQEASVEKLKNPSYNLIMIDIDQNIEAGIQLVSELRQIEIQTPVLMLCPHQALDAITPHLEAHEFDFLLKPVSVPEMKARAKALIQIQKASGFFEKFQLKSAGVILDLTSRRAYRGEQPIHLQNNEFELLEFMMRNAGRVITKTEILEKIWNYRFDPQTNVVDVLVWRLRSKIDRQFANKVIQTVRGVGYTFRPV